MVVGIETRRKKKLKGFDELGGGGGDRRDNRIVQETNLFCALIKEKDI
jgi:hypothetical protein